MQSVSLYPDTTGDVIVAAQQEGTTAVNLCVVDSTGNPVTPGLSKPVALVADGGSVQVKTYVTDANIGILTGSDQHPTVAEV